VADVVGCFQSKHGHREKMIAVIAEIAGTGVVYTYYCLQKMQLVNKEDGDSDSSSVKVAEHS
jgi:hypothetical protein